MSVRRAPDRRVVLLGASNLMRGISTVVATAQRVWGQPLEVLAAGAWPILWHRKPCAGSAFAGNSKQWYLGGPKPVPPLPTAVLITDVGNDILYVFQRPSRAWSTTSIVLWLVAQLPDGPTDGIHRKPWAQAVPILPPIVFSQVSAQFGRSPAACF